MTGIRAEIRGLKEVQAKMEQVVKDLNGAPYLNAMRDATLIVTRDAKRNAPVDTGRLRASITPEVKQRWLTTQGVVGSNVKYAPYVELGTRPHWPPLGAIQGWVHRKGLAGVYSIKTHRRVGGKAQQQSEDRQIAFLISRAIAARGTKPVEFLKRAFDDNKERIVALLGRAVTGIVRK
jgi:HK97 gp10 family phage protein